jgi:hypothetical protein
MDRNEVGTPVFVYDAGYFLALIRRAVAATVIL